MIDAVVVEQDEVGEGAVAVRAVGAVDAVPALPAPGAASGSQVGSSLATSAGYDSCRVLAAISADGLPLGSSLIRTGRRGWPCAETRAAMW
jgi:hypothetical protein